MTDINEAIKQFETVESNLDKLDDIWGRMHKLIPTGYYRDDGSEECLRYRDLAEDLSSIIEVMPSIDGLRLQNHTIDYDDIGAMRIENFQYGEQEFEYEIEKTIFQQAEVLRQYRNAFDRKRTELVIRGMEETIEQVDLVIARLDELYNFDELPPNDQINAPDWEELSILVERLQQLMGSSIPKPARWGNLNRHLHFGMVGDLNDIVSMDWPTCKESFLAIIAKTQGPVSVGVPDLAELIGGEISGTLLTALNWKNLSPGDFERLIFHLLSNDKSFRSVDWLTSENAPDRGRDISAERVVDDKLCNSRTNRIIIQCKHWTSKSIALRDIREFLDQVKLWEPPMVDEVIIAASGRFTTDAVDWVEKRNFNRERPYIHMWPESRLEQILSSSPGLIAEYDLR